MAVDALEMVSVAEVDGGTPMTQPSEQPTRRCQTWGAYSGRRCELQQGHRGGHRLEVITEPLTHEAAAPTRPQLRDRKPNPIIIEPIGTPDPVPSPALALGGSPLDRSLIRAAISNAYYECREAGESMETAADRAAHAVMELAPVATCDHTSTGRRTINGPDGRMAGAETFCVACGLVLRPDPVASPLALKIEADGSISRISGGPLEQPVHTKGTVGPFWDEIEAWRDGYRAGLSAIQSDDLTEGDGA